MNRYEWLMWAFRLFIKGDIIKQVQEMVLRLCDSQMTGKQKREYIEEKFMPLMQDAGVYILRGLVEILLAKANKA